MQVVMKNSARWNISSCGSTQNIQIANFDKKKNRNVAEVSWSYNKQLSLCSEIRLRLVIVALKMSD